MKTRAWVYSLVVTLCLGGGWAWAGSEENLNGNGQVTIYVSRDGYCGGHTPCYSTIQDGIDSVSVPSIIKITQETYHEDVVLDVNQIITLEGGWDTSFTSCSSYTFITGSMTIADGTMILGGTGRIILSTPPPTINSFSANPGTVNSGQSSTLSWSITSATSASIDQGVGSVNSAGGSIDVSPATTTTYTLTATNTTGSDTAQVTVTVIPIPPTINSLSVNPDTIDLGQSSTLSWTITNATSASIDQGIGSVNPSSGSVTVTPVSNTKYTLTATNSFGSVTAQVSVIVNGGIPPDPATVAPPLDLTVATTVSTATSFLYTGTNPIQTGVAPGTIDAKRVAVLRGKVLNPNGDALPGVTISILNHPEYGQTLSRLDGMFDLAVNGGGLLTVNYNLPGYLIAQRQVQVPWQDYVWLKDVVLITTDPQVSVINFSAPIQVSRGSVITDSDGTRQSTLLFSQGTTAQMVLPDGSTQNISSLSVRATEYSVGPNGPKAMPAELPPGVGYTYCVEFTADEASTAGATNVVFSKPVYHYVENFLNFPVGGIVPVGYYDRQKGQWIPSQNGRVIKVLGVTNGQADLDINGDGLAEDSTSLAALGITDAERAQLINLYPVGASLWRVPIFHFSPWDCNWSYGPPWDAVPPDPPPPQKRDIDDPCKNSGSIVECQNQILGEAVAINGTPFRLHYQSDRVPGRKTRYSRQINMTSANLPASLIGVELVIDVAGQHFEGTFAPSPNLTYTFTWDGKDAYGRTVQGIVPLNGKIGYVYQAVYMQPGQVAQSFAQFSGVPMTGNMARLEITLWKEWQDGMGVMDSRSQGQIGGWTFNVHHAYDFAGRILYLGDGSRRSGTGLISNVITTVAGNGTRGYAGDGGPATQAKLSLPGGVAVGPDGAIYIADSSNNRIRRVGTDGIITTVAGNGTAGYAGDGGPATQAQLGDYPRGVAVGPDGAIYIADSVNFRIRRVGTDGIITTVAGNGSWGYGGDGGPATQAKLYYPIGVAVGPDGAIYIADSYNNRIRRVGTDGIITTVAGNGTAGYAGDGGPATQAQFDNLLTVTVGPDGVIYITDYLNNRIRRVGTDGIITTVAGNGTQGYSGDGGPATQAKLYYPIGVAVGPDGAIYIADDLNNRIRRVGIDGIITTVAGNGTAGYAGDGGPATQAQLNSPWGVAVGPDGAIYIADASNNRIRRVAPVMPDFALGDFVFPAEDGSEFYHFNASGRHLQTLDALTGVLRHQFTYDISGKLTAVQDGNGNTTTIERDSNRNPQAIVGPFGQRTTLSLDSNGYLKGFSNPAGEAYQFTYSNDGLLLQTTDPKGNSSNYAYDSLGRLLRDTNAAGGSQALARVELANGYEVSRTTAMGRVTTYLVENLPDGSQRSLNTFPDGTTTETIVGTDGSQTTTYSDGTVISTVFGPDPRFGMQAPITRSQTRSTAGGLGSTTTTNRTATLTDPNNPLSLTTTDAATVNGRPYTSVFHTATNTFTRTSPERRNQSAVVDGQGRFLSFRLDPSLLPINITYTPLGLLSQMAWGDQIHNFEYDNLGRPVAVTNAAGNKKGFEYDAADRVSRVILPSGRAYGFSYDQNSNLAQVVMPSGAIHALSSTKVNLDSSYTPPGSPPYLLSYDLEQAWVQTAFPSGRTLDASYDTGGRPTGWTYPEAQVELAYAPGDKTSRVQSVVRTPTGQGVAQKNSLQYDGQLVTGLSFSGASNGQFTYAYDNNFFLTGLSLVSGTDTVGIGLTRDADGLTTQYGPFTWMRSGPAGEISWITDGVLQIFIGYDDTGRAVSRTHGVNGVPVFQIQTAFDNTGHISQKVESVGGISSTKDYSYDADGQLISVMRDGSTFETYSYDANGNRTMQQYGTAPPVTATYDNQDRLISQGGVDYQYDSDGYLVQRGADTFTYSVRGELLQATVGGQTVSYVYDGFGRRVARIGESGTTQYLYGNISRPFQLTASREPSGQFTLYYYAQDRVFAMDRGGNRYYVATDQVGTPRVVTDNVGGTIKVIESDSYGNVLSDSNADFFLPVGFAGGLPDPDTGLVRFGYRDYDPSAARWTAKDPIFFQSDQMNFYGYVGNDPIFFVDPTGLGISGRGGGRTTRVDFPPGTITVYLNAGPSEIPGVGDWVDAGTQFNGTFTFGDPGDQEGLPEKPPQAQQNNAKCNFSPSEEVEVIKSTRPVSMGEMLNKTAGYWRLGKEGKALKLGVGWLWGWLTYLTGGVERIPVGGDGGGTRG